MLQYYAAIIRATRSSARACGPQPRHPKDDEIADCTNRWREHLQTLVQQARDAS